MSLDTSLLREASNKTSMLEACLSLADAASLSEIECRLNYWLKRLYAPLSWGVFYTLDVDDEPVFLMEGKARSTESLTIEETQAVRVPLEAGSISWGRLELRFLTDEWDPDFDEDGLARLTQVLSNRLYRVYNELRALTQMIELLFTRSLLHGVGRYNVDTGLDQLAANLLQQLNVSSIQILVDRLGPGGISWGISSRRADLVLSFDQRRSLLHLAATVSPETQGGCEPHLFSNGTELRQLAKQYDLPFLAQLQLMLIVPIWGGNTLQGAVVIGEERSATRQPLAGPTVCVARLLARLVAEAVMEGRIVEELIARDRATQALADALEDAVLLTKDGSIISSNPAAQKLFGYTAEEAAGRLIQDVLSGAPAELFSHNGSQITSEQPTPSFEWEMQATGGRSIHVSGTTKVLPNVVSGSPSILYLIKEVNQEREFEFLKDELLSIVSHELRTPLNGIYGFGRLLLERPYLSDSMRQEALETLQSSIERLSRMADDFIDVARARRHHLPLELDEVDIEEVTRSAVRELRRRHTKHIIVLRVQKQTPLVRGDSLRIKQILDNLVSNAAKYSPEGTRITISVRVRAAVVAINISDQGQGISEAAQERIFEAFYRTSSARQKRASGVGLGLSIVKSLVQAHNGQVTVRSRVGRGSTFTFTLPIIEEQQSNSK